MTTVVIGVGNALRGDDGAGLAAVARIPASPGVEVLSHSGDGSNLLELWDGAEAVVIVDSMASGADPGTIQRFDVSAEPLPAAARRPAGHTFGVAEAIEAARALGRLPRRAIVIGVEGADFELGAGLSEPVCAVLDMLAAAASEEARPPGRFSRWRADRSRGSRSR